MTKQSNRYSRYYTYIKPITNIPIIKNYGSTIFTLIAMIIFIIFAIKPTVETIVVLQKKLSDSQQILDKVTKKGEDLSLGKQNYDNLDPNIKTSIQSLIPDNIALKSLVQSLEQTARQNEASISALQIQPVSLQVKDDNTMGSLTTVSFVFNIEGQYPDLILLLQELKRSARLISIDNIVLNKLETGTGLLMSLTGKAYYIQ